ncbi:MAG: hypothetical protein Q7U86_05585 [Draconibacterium sp.]|nr:hypothetical protein [Draconibacterium sp.]
MHTLRLRVDNKTYKNLMWFLGRFSNDEIQIEEETDQFISTKQYLEKELNTIEEGKAEYISVEQLDENLEAILKSHED